MGDGVGLGVEIGVEVSGEEIGVDVSGEEVAVELSDVTVPVSGAGIDRGDSIARGAGWAGAV